MEKQLSEKESLTLITTTVQNARERIIDDGYYYLLWGYLILAAAISNYILLEAVGPEYAWVPWPLLMTLGGIISGVTAYRRSSMAPEKTFFDTAMISLWSAFLIALFMVLGFTAAGKIYPLACYPLIILIYGIGTWVAGGILKFKASKNV